MTGRGLGEPVAIAGWRFQSFRRRLELTSSLSGNGAAVRRNRQRAPFPLTPRL